MTRELLPRRRGQHTFEYYHQGFTYTASVGFYSDGRVGEVFLTSVKSGYPMQTIAVEAAIAVSFALQHGADIYAMQDAMPRRENSEPQGLIGGLLDRMVRLYPDGRAHDVEVPAEDAGEDGGAASADSGAENGGDQEDPSREDPPAV